MIELKLSKEEVMIIYGLLLLEEIKGDNEEIKDILKSLLDKIIVQVN